MEGWCPLSSSCMEKPTGRKSIGTRRGIQWNSSYPGQHSPASSHIGYVLHHPYIWQHTDQKRNGRDPHKCQDTAQWCEVQCTHFHATWTAWTAQFYNNTPSNARDVHSIAMQEQPMAMQSSFKCVYVRNYLPA